MFVGMYPYMISGEGGAALRQQRQLPNARSGDGRCRLLRWQPVTHGIVGPVATAKAPPALRLAEGGHKTRQETMPL